MECVGGHPAVRSTAPDFHSLWGSETLDDGYMTVLWPRSRHGEPSPQYDRRTTTGEGHPFDIVLGSGLSVAARVSGLTEVVDEKAERPMPVVGAWCDDSEGVTGTHGAECARIDL